MPQGDLGMDYGEISGIGKPVSRLVLGTMIVSSEEPERSHALLDAAVELGYTAFDTAHGYAGGNSERGLGQWMRARGNREQVVIVGKGCHHNRDRRRVTAFDLASDLYDSLARLQSDYIDLYLLHRDDPTVPVGPIVEALNEHLEAGRIRAFGGSNWTHDRIAEANAYAAGHGLTPFVASSPNYGLADQIEDPWGGGCVTVSGPGNREARAWYVANEMPVLAYSSLARGLFSGRITPDNYEQTQSTLDRACRTAYCHEPNLRRLGRALRLSEEKGASVPQIVLAFMFGSPVDVYPIVGAASREELADNLRAFDVRLSQEERAWLDLKRDELGA
jgi:aryl-alcohol dehydrogenase-like predicted oxidoreductase